MKVKYDGDEYEVDGELISQFGGTFKDPAELRKPLTNQERFAAYVKEQGIIDVKVDICSVPESTEEFFGELLSILEAPVDLSDPLLLDVPEVGN